MQAAEALEVAPFLAPTLRKGRRTAAFFAEEAVWMEAKACRLGQKPNKSRPTCEFLVNLFGREESPSHILARQTSALSNCRDQILEEPCLSSPNP